MGSKKVYFSIVIPTLNEELNVQGAIKSILSQTFKNFEIIVADGKSNDKTVEIARKYCKTLIAPKRGISNQLNYALKHCRGEVICFMDADTRIANNALEKLYLVVKNDSSVVGGSLTYKYNDTSLKFKILSFIATVLWVLLKSGGGFVFVRKKAFDKVKFNQKYIAHDSYILREARKIGEIKIILDTFSITSVRRFKKEGFLKVLVKQGLLLFGTIFKIDFVSKRDYKFGDYK